MSPVVIIFMLILSAARAANIRSATPVCVRMPVPTIDTLLTSSLVPIVAAQLGGQRLQHGQRRGQLVAQHGEADGRLAAVPTFWAIMSTTMFCSAMAAKTRWLTPGWSGTPSRVTRASSLTMAAPQTGDVASSTPPRGRSRCPRRRVNDAAHLQRHVELLGELDATASA